jgi:hypothetical protein
MPLSPPCHSYHTVLSGMNTAAQDRLRSFGEKASKIPPATKSRLIRYAVKPFSLMAVRRPLPCCLASTASLKSNVEKSSSAMNPLNCSVIDDICNGHVRRTMYPPDRPHDNSLLD